MPKREGPTPPKKYTRRYPWSRWFAKSRFTLVKGKDYDVRSYTMAQMLRNSASAQEPPLSLEITIAPDESRLTVAVRRPPANGAER